MDTKALARSKRAHTQHHSRKAHHPNQASKVSSEGTGGSGRAKKPLGKQPKERTSRLQGLPSNLDRYDDEFDSDSEQNLAGNNASQTSDDILPKSKGADYRHLITEALANSQSSIDNFPFLDDVVPDFNQGVSSMLAIRGEGILSWIGNDNFVVDDRATTSNEASFLSLNLHALAEQLEEIELSKRLFIEADLLPPELCMEGSKTNSSHGSAKMQTPIPSKLPEGESTDLVLENFPQKVKITNESKKVISSDSANNIDIHLNEALESEELKANSATDGKPSFSSFKAEAELDMLLDSFDQTLSLDSGFGSIKSHGRSGQETSTSLLQVPDKSKTTPFPANFDDVLDDLLEETSNQKGSLQTQKINPPNNASKSKVLDDFDSWLDTI